MATFTYRNPTSSNLSTTVPSFTSGITPLTFSRNSRPIIYANYPEKIGLNDTGLALVENDYCINQQTISAGEAMIFFSHSNWTGRTLKYRVHMYNPTASTATVTRSNIGFSFGWDPGTTVENYYTTSNTSYTIARYASAWLTPEYSISAGGESSGNPFSGMIKISTNTSLTITLYAYYSSSIDGNEGVYPYNSSYSEDLKVYSGVGNGFFLTAPHGTINLSTMPYRYITNMTLANTNEITAIDIVGTSYQASESNPDEQFNNLGNWCTQNYHTMTLYNDTGSAKTVYGYIGTNALGNTPAVAKGSTINSVPLTQDNGKHIWKWCSIVLAAGESYTFNWQTILASYGTAATWHEWSLTNRMA